MDTTAIVSEALSMAEAHGNAELSNKLRELKKWLQLKAFGPQNYFYRNDNTEGLISV
jgi:hypothetical protein